MSSLDARALKHRLEADPPPLLLHVLPEEIFTASRIAGSCHACVYETAFLSKVAGLAPDKAREIIVYGAGAPSHDVEAAVAKLEAAGYTHVSGFSGGLDAWREAGFACESDGPLPCAPQPDGCYRVDAEQSVIRWTGRNLFNHHHGTAKLARGELKLEAGELRGASFVIDMNSIACEDLTDESWNAMLIRHLRDADFFEIEKHPAAEFTATSAEPIVNATEGVPNYLVHGQFTLRGTTRPLSFPAVIASADGSRITGQAQIQIDRTEYGSLYGSGKFFRFLGKHVVNDHIHLHVKLHADRVDG